ncbi:DUF397 domain-containing protein [Solihabitans fulvus]|uniref:DUF397 domain-containing protein n=1 Tax=Solihabitans fulvus TaxID=1892852 RepID=A0A5B2WX00_9PSEU|nr:DUF397 domain-containing protein [Solihabitans fulvus]KAA2254959.1 DUF397 domain-containing protein [Solihabitans fulvus]
MTAHTRLLASWRKSSYSANEENCVEVAFTPAMVGLRDSKSPAAGHIEVHPSTFRAFVDGIKATRPDSV